MQTSLGDILLARFPYTDLSSDKRRPVLVLSAHNIDDDVIVCAITSQPQSGAFDVAVWPDQQTGLKQQSWVQFDKIATLSKSIVAGRLGAMPRAFMATRHHILRQLLGLDGLP